jgi:hypothetical protein
MPPREAGLKGAVVELNAWLEPRGEVRGKLIGLEAVGREVNDRPGSAAAVRQGLGRDAASEVYELLKGLNGARAEVLAVRVGEAGEPRLCAAADSYGDEVDGAAQD